MSTYSTDDQLLLRVPLCVSALQRINAERAKIALGATTLLAYRTEAQRQLQDDLGARGVDVSLIADVNTLREPEVCLTAALLFEAATVRSAPQTAQPDVFATASIVWRDAYGVAIGKVRATPQTRPQGAVSFEGGRG